ncbi:hypothetical protein NC651_038239 [Populus alba x Populus x berolinensis]|nr:hypothetical protein NC651_038239 [Populus alba x Populus x berolinensis]
MLLLTALLVRGSYQIEANRRKSQTSIPVEFVQLELITGHPPISTTESVINESLVAWARPRSSKLWNMEVLKLLSIHGWAQIIITIVRVLEGGKSADDLKAGIFRPPQHNAWFFKKFKFQYLPIRGT